MPALLFRRVTIFCLILSAATLFAVGLRKAELLTPLPPDDPCLELDGVVS